MKAHRLLSSITLAALLSITACKKPSAGEPFAPSQPQSQQASRDAWQEKEFSALEDREIEATMNVTKRVFDAVLGKDLPKYYQTENLTMLKKSGYFDGDPTKLNPLSKPSVGLSAAYATSQMDVSVIQRLEKQAEASEIDWKGIHLAVTDALVEVIPNGAGDNHDKVTIFALRVRVFTPGTTQSASVGKATKSPLHPAPTRFVEVVGSEGDSRNANLR